MEYVMTENVEILEVPDERVAPADKQITPAKQTEPVVERIKNYGRSVTLAAVGINLALGVLYSWSIITGGMDSEGWGWTQAQKSLPYSIACLVFCLMMVPAGRMHFGFRRFRYLAVA